MMKPIEETAQLRHRM